MKNLNKKFIGLKRELFGNLSNKAKTISADSKAITFMRKIEFGSARLYFEYNFKNREIDQIYTNSHKNKKIIYGKNDKLN